MFGLTKLALKRPVTVMLTLVTIFFFGLQSVFTSKMELMPEMNLPMVLISTTYVGAAPADVDKLVTRKLEEGVGTLSGIKTVQTSSRENSSIVFLQYEYGTDMDKAYMDLRKAVDRVKSDLPKEVGDPLLMQFDINAGADIMLMVAKESEENLYGFVEKTLVPEFEKNSSVSRVSIAGGQKSYVRIELLQDKMEQYQLDMNTIASLITASNFNIPVGTVEYGRQNLNLSIGSDNKELEKIKNIVLPLKSGEVIRLADVAQVYGTLEDKSSLSRFNGEDVISLSISRQQSSSAVDLSKQVMATVDLLLAENEGLQIEVINDNAVNITDSIKSVFQTLLLSVVLSMVVLFVFFGDMKASLIVGSSIPISVMLSLAMMGAAGFSMNMISLGALVLGVGMIVDASIVVLDSCFKEKKDRNFYEAALEGTRVVIASIVGSTITTCVVFVPLALLKGLSGQLFAQLGWTIVFCMMSSLFSAISIVPLLFLFTHPREKENTISHKAMAWLERKYAEMVDAIIPRRAFVISTAVILLVLSIVMAFSVGVELMPQTDNGRIRVQVATIPGLKIEELDALAKQVEERIKEEPDVEKYFLSYGGEDTMSPQANTAIDITAYLKKDRGLSTSEVINKWKESFEKISDVSITVSALSDTSTGSSNTAVTIPLQGVDYDTVKKAADELVAKLQNEPYLTQVHSTAENAAPLLTIDIDPIKAQAYGLTPAAVAGTINGILRGTEVMRYTQEGSDIVVKLEYPAAAYESVNQVKDIFITTPMGSQVSVGELAQVRFKDSVVAIDRVNKQYQVSITAQAARGYEGMAATMAYAYVDAYDLPDGVSRSLNFDEQSTNEELMNLLRALLTAIFLVFIVMAIQFESPRFSFMVMFTIPFSLIGAFGLLFLFNVKISMPSMLGFLMMVGTVVNNGILYVDTVNQLKVSRPLREALVEAGVSRLRPILMTTLTTMLSMLPMALAWGDNAEALQGLALVNVGGLLASTLLSLLLLPTLYEMIDKKSRKLVGENGDALQDVD